MALALLMGPACTGEDPAPVAATATASRAPGVVAMTVFLPESVSPEAVETALSAAISTHLPGHGRVGAVPRELTQPAVLVERLDRSRLQPPSPALLQAHSPDIGLDELRQVAAADAGVVVVVLTPPGGPPVEQVVGAADRAVAALAEATGGMVLDDDTLQLLRPEQLRERAGGGVLAHTTVRVAQHDNTLRAVTLGMARYGCPELVVERFRASETAGVHALLELARQSIAEREGLPTTPVLRLDIAAVADPVVQGAQLERMVPGATGAAAVGLRWPKAREDDPDNALLELVFEPDLTTTLLALYGTDRPGPDLVARARDAARAELAGPVRQRFAAGLPPDDRLLVKGPFVDAEGTGVEWMWVAVERWENSVFTGVLTNTPDNIPGLHEGTTVQVPAAEVFDYLYVHADGRTEGNRTAALLELGG